MPPKPLQFILAISAAVMLAGCGKNATPAASGGMATQGAPPPTTENYEGIDLAQLTRDLKRWIVATKERPTSFEDYVAKAKPTVPSPPAGKRFAISKEMRVILVAR